MKSDGTIDSISQPVTILVHLNEIHVNSSQTHAMYATALVISNYYENNYFLPTFCRSE